jgi:hypothetical protein
MDTSSYLYGGLECVYSRHFPRRRQITVEWKYSGFVMLLKAFLVIHDEAELNETELIVPGDRDL